MTSTLRVAARVAAIALTLSGGVAAPASAQAFIGSALGHLTVTLPGEPPLRDYPTTGSLTSGLWVAHAAPSVAAPRAAPAMAASMSRPRAATAASSR